ncbi:VC_2705 family sodium/solute symporter [Aliarcobacter cryaerophilus]|jgi:cation/acetate symporter|uniref:VC_2705 family sodium/solute symporter n=1 Tax=Aliarcobacter cryaerophilus TaxID=28198 RepID=UPI0009CD1416|nr:VC_2705 family sodium/solute symporter [Aliarcobacter cryaerophilus]OQA75009.1 MAG: Cation/acetate symporter ActP [Candidatus Dependentiae bacterium ADurb.Bin246]MCT7464057.1 VC_2705 family sodium/solute symporter [Aliarcobacter cryaerophilus]MCT7496070.1 VC_2705 family sodium/solute symporter [Aliarcobacter cryaerophilus]MCT7535234.1 VC_2705 family sodium/solute symporter [Aliarcobacter cryaerophilus]HRG60371.1 VC_2705 family sodium/solute symporter [Aliarcobacter cryaerophilus]
MELQSLIYLFVGVSFTIYFGLALWTKASSTKDFYVANKSFNPVFNGASIAVDFISAATFISLCGAFLSFGYDSFAYIIGITSGFVLLTILIVPYLRKMECLSIPLFFEKRFNSKLLKITTIIIVVLVSFIYISAQLKGVGIIFSRIFQLDLSTALLIGMCITLFYAFIGGMKNIAYTQIAQYIIILFSFMTPIFFLTIEFTNSYLPQLAIFSKSAIYEERYLIEVFEQTLNDYGFKSFSEFNVLNSLLIAISLSLGVASLPHILIKFFSTPTVNDARRSSFWALVFISVIYTSISSLFILSTLNLVKKTNSVEYDAFINNEIEGNEGKWLKTWEKTGLVKFEDFNKNNKIDLKYENNISELSINPDALSLLTPEIANLPNWVISLVLAGALAATLSTITGLILIIKTTISYELLKENFSKNNIIARVIFSKLLIVLIIVLATLFYIPNYTILQTVAIAFTICAATLFPTLVLGIFYKKINKIGAIFGVISSLFFTLSYCIYFLYINSSSNYFFGISSEAIGSIGAILNILITVIVSKLTSKQKNINESIDFTQHKE